MDHSARILTPFQFNTCKVRDIASRDPRFRRALEEAGIDTCCGGKRPIREAADAAGIERGQLADLLEKALIRPREPVPVDWTEEPVPLLIDYLISHHHAYLYKHLPLTGRLFERALNAHQDHAAELVPLFRLFTRLSSELLPHLEKEETRLFPLVQLPGAAESLRMLVLELEQEHTGAGNLVHALHEQSCGYRIPDYACPTVEQLFTDLAELDAKLHEHIYLENNILFPPLEE